VSIRRALLMATALLAVTATSVAADHGYWPETGKTPARVTGHEEATDQTTTASQWGPRCEVSEIGGVRGSQGLDVYGAILTADYDLVVVGVAAEAANFANPDFLDGPYGLTVYRSPKEGQFVWADADGDGRFANRHEADLTLLIICPALPATDTIGGMDGKDQIPQSPLATLAVLMATAVVIVLALAHYPARRRDRESQCGVAGE